MKSYQNEHLTIIVECGVHLLQQQWVNIPSGESFRQGSQLTLSLARHHQIKRWLIDLRQLRMFNPTDIQWFIQHWLPKAVVLLQHNVRIAVVLNDANQFGKLGADLILRASTTLNDTLTSRYFTDTEEARLWLMLPY